MKKLMVLTTLLVFFSNINSQTPQTKDELLLKSKGQRTTGWVLLIGGVGLAVGGAAWAASDWYSSGPDVVMAIGGTAMLSSVPFFIAAGKNKRKALSLSASTQRIPVIRGTIEVYKTMPSISIKVNF